jgi:tetratricopeptide (TPR) repeat protein
MPSRFELGNVRAQRGDLAGALTAFRQVIADARADGDQMQEVLAHNNAAYHALLAGDLMAARTHSTTGLALAETYGVRALNQWLYSTCGELALAEGQWAEAEAWFTRGMAEAQRYGNRSQLATYQANLGLTARGRGDRDDAMLLLEQARQRAAALRAPHLQSQIDLWLAEVYQERGEHTAALDALTRAEGRLAGGEQRRLQAWATQVRQAVSTMMPSRPPVALDR